MFPPLPCTEIYNSQSTASPEARFLPDLEGLLQSFGCEGHTCSQLTGPVRYVTRLQINPSLFEREHLLQSSKPRAFSLLTPKKVEDELIKELKIRIPFQQQT